VTADVTVSAPRRRPVRDFVDSITGRLLIASGVIAVLIAIVFATLVASVDDLRTATSREARARELSVAVVGLEKLVVDLDNGVRGYALSKADRRFLQPYTAARAALPARLKQFRTLTADDPATRIAANQLIARIQGYVDEYAEPLLAFIPLAPEAAQSSDSILESRTRIADVRRRFTALQGMVNAEATARAATASNRAQRSVILGATGIVLSTGLVVLLGLYLTHSIGRPLRRASSGAARIAEGDFQQHLAERGPLEIRDLSRSFNQMAAEVAARERELAEQNEELRASEQLKSELVSIVSHEIRTPLASVLGFTSLLLQREVSDEDRRRYLEIIDTQGKRLASLLDDFLVVQRIEEGRLPLDHVRVDVASLLREQVQLYDAQSDRHILDLRLPTQPLEVEGDPNRIAQVVGNLLSNAIKFSPEGGQVHVSGDQDNGRIRVTVRDHGLGIAAEQQDRIFTKFYRADAAASGIAGSGLGLAFARAVVDAHGGEIGFRSAPAKGSTFWIDLPAANGRES
jgi:signal transduction histidine kinase